MTDDHLTKAAGYLQLGLHQQAWDQVEEMDPEDRALPQAVGVRLGALKGLEKWGMGSEIATGAVKTYPESAMLWVMGAYHMFFFLPCAVGEFPTGL